MRLFVLVLALCALQVVVVGADIKQCVPATLEEYKIVKKDTFGQFGIKSRKLCSYSYGIDEWEVRSSLASTVPISVIDGPIELIKPTYNQLESLIDDLFDIAEYEIKVCLSDKLVKNSQCSEHSEYSKRAEKAADILIDRVLPKKIDDLRTSFYRSITYAPGICGRSKFDKYNLIYCDENMTTELLQPLARMARFFHEHGQDSSKVKKFKHPVEDILSYYDDQWRGFGGIGIGLQYVGESVYSKGPRIMHNNGLAIIGSILIDLYQIDKDPKHLYRLWNITDVIKNSIYLGVASDDVPYCIWNYAADDNNRKEDGNHGVEVVDFLIKLNESDVPLQAKLPEPVVKKLITTLFREGMTGNRADRSLRFADPIIGTPDYNSENAGSVVENCARKLNVWRHDKRLFLYCAPKGGSESPPIICIGQDDL